VDFLLCDESSMLDLTIVREIFRALPLDAQIVSVGDRESTSACGAGHFFHDLIECDFAVSKLDKIYRQKAGSGIIQAAHSINSGEMLKKNFWIRNFILSRRTILKPSKKE
jgi:exodeoxyribonuclease V alpha subunit